MQLCVVAFGAITAIHNTTCFNALHNITTVTSVSMSVFPTIRYKFGFLIYQHLYI